MWTIIKINKKKFSMLKKDFNIKLKKKCLFYDPKFLIQVYKNNKLLNKEFSLLGDYSLCYSKSFEDIQTVNQLKYCRGLKYFLAGFYHSQKQIEAFIKKCKDLENPEGYLSKNFYSINLNRDYQFTSGPFVEKIFKIVNLQKNKIDIYIGNLKTSIQNKEFLFKPI